MRLKRALPYVVGVLAFAVIVVLSACTPKGNFDGWFARQGYTIKHEPVPCAIFPDNCGGNGQTDIVNKIIYLDDARIAQLQATHPGVDVMQWMLYHEESHVADRAAGFVEGIGTVEFEHAAQCGAELLLGFALVFYPPNVYWDCPDADLAKTRWIWTANHII